MSVLRFSTPGARAAYWACRGHYRHVQHSGTVRGYCTGGGADASNNEWRTRVVWGGLNGLGRVRSFADRRKNGNHDASRVRASVECGNASLRPRVVSEGCFVQVVRIILTTRWSRFHVCRSLWSSFRGAVTDADIGWHSGQLAYFVGNYAHFQVRSAGV